MITLHKSYFSFIIKKASLSSFFSRFQRGEKWEKRKFQRTHSRYLSPLPDFVKALQLSLLFFFYSRSRRRGSLLDRSIDNVSTRSLQSAVGRRTDKGAAVIPRKKKERRGTIAGRITLNLLRR